MEDEPSLERSLPMLGYGADDDDAELADLAALDALGEEEAEQATPQLCHMQRQNTVGQAFHNWRSEGVSAVPPATRVKSG